MVEATDHRFPSIQARSPGLLWPETGGRWSNALREVCQVRRKEVVPASSICEIESGAC